MSVEDEIVRITFDKLRTSGVFDEATLQKLLSLAQEGKLSDEDEVMKALTSGMDHK